MTLRRALTACVLGLGMAHAAQALPAFNEVRTGWRSSEVRVLDRHGELVEPHPNKLVRFLYNVLSGDQALHMTQRNHYGWCNHCLNCHRRDC